MSTHHVAKCDSCRHPWQDTLAVIPALLLPVFVSGMGIIASQRLGGSVRPGSTSLRPEWLGCEEEVQRRVQESPRQGDIVDRRLVHFRQQPLVQVRVPEGNARFVYCECQV
jgi:hypothetical protein